MQRVLVKEQIYIIGNENQIIDGLTSEVKAIRRDEEDEIVCPLCGETDRVSTSIPHIENAKSLYGIGWRYASSDHYELEGYFCPACSREETPESQGEY